MTAELVGPVPTIRFRGGAKVAYDRPKDTRDPRWEACTDHRPACDCREAELAEGIAELRAELEAVRRAAREVLAGHPTFAYEDGPNGERPIGCACSGCRLVRAADVGLLTGLEAGPYARDAVDGLSTDQLEAGWRWRVCLVGVRSEPTAEECRRSVRRDRGHYHEHLHDGSGSMVPLPQFDPFNEVPF